jgi:Tfp pilus assembly protein PilE
MVKTSRSSGLTIVELLIVIAIIGALLATLLPAVLAARESGRKSTCTNHLKEICLAATQYTAIHGGRLPASWRNVRNRDGEAMPTSEYEFARSSFSWRSSILPFVGEQSLYDKLKFDSTPMADENSEYAAKLLGLFQCPSTPDSPRSVLAESKATEMLMGASDYVHVFFVGIKGTQDTEFPYRHISAEHVPGAWYGLGRYDSTSNVYCPLYVSSARGSASLKYVVDGLSHTILVAEKAGYPNSYYEGNVVEPSPWGEGVWAAGEFGGFGKAKVNWSNFPSIYSFHPSEAHIALCDGSVKLLADDADLDIIVALCSRSGGESLGRLDSQ